uniref:Uncharacterized protein n=1 Tax=Oryza nivara TaxID=4536 RepID=A0A679BBS1_ORYNI|nr:hypothetical protein [Oryza sativa f. spontanea]
MVAGGRSSPPAEQTECSPFPFSGYRSRLHHDDALEASLRFPFSTFRGSPGWTVDEPRAAAPWWCGASTPKKKTWPVAFSVCMGHERKMFVQMPQTAQAEIYHA